jgi:transcriptional regulator with XRE-family HTH domain
MAHRNHEVLGDPPSWGGLSSRVGRRIRTLRETQGVTLSQLASASGLGKGTLSELENGARNPTLGTLFAITTALNSPLSDLLADDDLGSADEVRADGTAATLLYRHDTPFERFDLFVLRLSGPAHLSQAHGAGVRETLSILEGTVRAGPIDDAVVMAAGQTIEYAGDVPHSYESLGGTAVGIILMRYPAAGEGASAALPGEDLR